MKRKPQAGIVVAGLVGLAVFSVYLPALRNGFVWDDIAYVSQNPFIRSINGAFFVFAFLGFHLGNWHPLTWISHAIDYSIWGLNPFGHHLTNIVLHSINSLIVSLIVMRLLAVSNERKRTKALPGKALNDRTVLMAGAITGLLFGLHPLHVESVAWIAERKDLLCALFFLLSTMSYIKYESILDRGKIRIDLLHGFRDRNYRFSIVFFIIALMSKPMAVSLPFVLIIIDWYPFQRIRSLKTLMPAFFEKLPFFVLSLLSAIVTILAQKAGGAMTMIKVPLSVRALVAARGLALYLWKMVLPLNLVPYYPYPKSVSFLSPEYLFLTIFLVGVTLFCVLAAGKWKLLISAWGYYVLTLLPVLGIVQVGIQSMADRYTYLPSIGPFIVLSIAVAVVCEKVASSRRKMMRNMAFFALLVVFVFFSFLTIQQIGIWKNSVVFWNYVIEKEPGKVFFAHYNLGKEYQSERKYDLAVEQYRTALRIRPDFPEALNNLGNTYGAKGLLDKAIEQYKIALRLKANYAEARSNLGVAYQMKGLFNLAVRQYKIALSLDPDSAKAHANLGDTYRSMGLSTEAVKQYLIALELAPDDEEVHSDLGNMFFSRGLFALAIRHYREAVKLKPGDSVAHFNLAIAYQAEGRLDKAVEEYKTALSLNPHDARGHFNLGKIYLKKGESGLAKKEFEAALRSKPNYAKAMEALKSVMPATRIATEARRH